MSQDEKPDPAGPEVQTQHPGDELATAALVRWTRRPRPDANRAVVTFGALAMVWLTVFGWQMPDRVSFLRHVAMIFIFVHAGWHVAILRELRHLRDRGLPAAEDALYAYLDPRRISNLDMAMVWLAFALLVRILSVALSPGVSELP